MNRKLEVVGLGLTTLDYLGLVPHLPRLDEGAPLLDFARQGGGPVAQALVTLSRLGASVGFVGRIGDDEAGDVMRAGLVEEGVDVGRLQMEPGATSGQCIILVDHPSGKRSICAHRGSVREIQVARGASSIWTGTMGQRHPSRRGRPAPPASPSASMPVARTRASSRWRR